MRIGVDVYPLVTKRKAGIALYTEALLRSVLDKDRENQYYLYNCLGKKVGLEYPNVTVSPRMGWEVLNRFSTSWLSLYARSQMMRDNIDIFWGTQGFLPPTMPQTIKTVITVHDLIFYHYPDAMALGNYYVVCYF